MPFLRVLPLLGTIIMVFAATMLVPLLVSWRLDDGASSSYPLALLFTLVVGLLMRSVSWWRPGKVDLQARDGILLVGMVWTLLPVFASLPLMVYFAQAGSSLSFTDAYFEAMSALTTTGATVLVGLDSLPASINLWRCFLQWLGGMGILVLAVAILPMLGVGGSQLFRAEATGPMKETKLTPGSRKPPKGSGRSMPCFPWPACWPTGLAACRPWMRGRTCSRR